jgi:hypothetical protein
MMARKVFHSFHYDRDSWRVQQVKNMGVLEGQPLLSSNAWEDVKRGGDSAIQEWIDDQMSGKSCVVVLIGSQTAGRKWVKYEIKKGWNDGKGVVGVYIHKLEDSSGNQDSKGRNPFDDFSLGSTKLSSIVRAHDSSYSTGKYVYDDIKQNLASWVEDAIAIRGRNSGSIS